MDLEAPIGEKRRGFRRWRLAVTLLLGIALLTFLLGNLFLSSSWSRRWIAQKIERRTGLETRIGGASWTPWNGAAIHTIELLQPPPLRAAVKEPLARIASIRITPVWPAWLRGRPEIRSIHLDSPRWVLPIELLFSLSQSTPPATVAPPPPPPPVVAVVPPPAVIPPPTPPVVAAPKPPPIPQPPPQPTGWLHLKNASFVVVHAGSQRSLLEIAQASGRIPVSGNPAESRFRFGAVSAFGKTAVTDLTATLEWNSPMLSLKPLDLKIADYQLLLAAKIATFSGLPLQIEAQLPRQKLAAIALPFGSQAAAESLTANARFRGLLLSPATWQGDFLAEATSPSLQVATHQAEFDKGSVVTVLRGGVISCVDARLIGDTLSLLGNATLLADGRCAGIGRLVSSPETTATIARRMFPAIPGDRPLTPLSTPQRVAFDLEAAGNISELFLRLGKDGPIAKFKL